MLIHAVDLFSIPGRGMVVAGRVEAGVVSIGDRVLLQTPVATLQATVAGVEQARKVVASASAGADVALLFRGVSPEDLWGARTAAAPDWPPATELRIGAAPRRWWEVW